MTDNVVKAFLFWKTLKFFLKNNCPKICTIQIFVVPLSSISAINDFVAPQLV